MKYKKLLIAVCVVVFVFGIRVYSKEKNIEDNNLPNVNEASLKYFEKKCEYEEIITYAEEDINNDGENDLVVIYKKDKKYNEMVSIINNKDKIYATKPVLAPKEDVVITFKDIDKKNQMEVMISGSKNGNIGYMIYRLEGTKLIDLFGEGMKACC